MDRNVIIEKRQLHRQKNKKKNSVDDDKILF